MVPGKFCSYDGTRYFLVVPDVVDLLHDLFGGRMTPDEAVNGLVDRTLLGLDVPSKLQGDLEFRAWVFEQVRDISEEIVGRQLVQVH